MNGRGDADVTTGHLDTDSPDFGRESSKIEQEALERKIKLGKAHDHISALIRNCSESGTPYLDLSQKHLSEIPDELLRLSHIEVSPFVSISYKSES